MDAINAKYQVTVMSHSLECGEVGKHLYSLPLSDHKSLKAACRVLASMIHGKRSKTFRSDHNLYGVGYKLGIKDLTTKEFYSLNKARKQQ